MNAFKRLLGVAAVNRLDDLRMGVARDAVAHAKIDQSYQAYALRLGFQVDPHQIETITCRKHLASSVLACITARHAERSEACRANSRNHFAV